MRQKRQQAVDIFTEYLINNKCCGSIQRGAVVIFLPSCRMPVAIEEKNPPYKNNNGTFPSPNRSDGILLTIKSKPHCLSNSLTNLRVSTKDTLSLFFVFFLPLFLPLFAFAENCPNRRYANRNVFKRQRLQTVACSHQALIHTAAARLHSIKKTIRS